jgi:MYXO-CTERM domain-containing protein
MTRQQRRIARRRNLTRIAVILAAAAALPSDVRGFGIAVVLNSKSLPEATVAVIDPESGTSSGTAGSDVNIAAGDIILFRFAFAPVPDKSNRSIQSYLTEYLPPGTELVGVRIIDAQGRTIRPRLPGLAIDGCRSSGDQCTTFDDLPCNGGADNCSFAGGSIAQIHGDTGVFFTADADLARQPANAFITKANGIVMDPAGNDLGDIDDLMDTAAPYRAHNPWDWAQVQAFGNSSAVVGNGGDGNLPFRYGSPVAGPQTYYLYEATDIDAGPAYDLELNDVVGPWQRIKYPGSMVALGGCITNPGDVTCTTGVLGTETRRITPADGASHCGATGDQPCVGTDVTPANPQAATAVRWALGEARTGNPAFVEVALRITDVPIDPNFGSGDNLDCGESFGAGLSTRVSGFGGSDQPQTGAANPWETYLPSPQCVFLKLLLDVRGNKPLANLENVDFTTRVRNLSLNTETGVVVRMQFDDAKIKYNASSATPAPDSQTPVACPAPDGTKKCLFWTLGTMGPSDEVVITSVFNTQGGGHISTVMDAVYTSNSLPGGYRTQDLTVVVPIALPGLTLRLPTTPSVFDPTVSFTSAGSTQTIQGTVSNLGTNSFGWEAITFVLPTGWTVAGNITIGGVSYSCLTGCAGNTPSFGFSVSQAAGNVRELSMVVNVPSGTADGLYLIDAQIWGNQTGGGFGGTFETYLDDLVELNVGKVRTAKPTIDCPVPSTAPSVTGDAEAGADVTLLFNLMPRGVDAADGSGDWEVTSYDAFGPFGSMYGGLELRAQATLSPKLPSVLSEPCEATPTRECSDGVDNDADGFIDFPADVGCDSLSDNTEANTDVEECRDTVNNDGDAFIDWPADLQCAGPFDDTEAGNPACGDGIDNDGDGDTDFPDDDDCTSATDATEEFTRECQDRTNNGDPGTDFDGRGGAVAADLDCHSAFDDDESDPIFQPDEVRGRILIIMDTSGSMNWNVCEDEFTGGDGSLDFPGDDVACVDLPPGCTAGQLSCGNGLADDSRLYKVKQGISNVVASFGEVEYGLMRFAQRPTDFVPPSTNASLASGGWQGGGARVGSPAQCSGGFNAGDLIVSFSDDNYQTMIDWMDGDHNYPDGIPPPGYDEELRGTGTTPLAGSMTSALTYLENAVTTGDPVTEGCREYRVILVTDGADTCSIDPIADPPAAADALFDARPGTRTEGFPVTVIGFATGDPTVTARLNAIASAGGTGSAVFVSDQAALSTAIAQVVSDSIRFEICNGVDDDCDTRIDEGFNLTDPLDDGDNCNNGEQGVCYEEGELVCNASGNGTECDAPAGTPTGTDEVPEPCDNVDDDCDGKVDEGLNCNCLTFETCNGVDDNCNGQIDEDPIAGEGDDCGIDTGECTFGSLECDGTAVPPRLVCTGGQGPIAESCNCDDDDCDTLTDEGSTECYQPSPADTGCTFGGGVWTCVGLCRTGLQTCDTSSCPGGAGGVGACVGDVDAAAELCNGFDDDCDGTVDNGFPLTDPLDPLDDCDNNQLGVCFRTGEIVCNADGTDTVCTAPTVTPGIEVCNGLDDDCDGTVDEADALDPPEGPVGEPCSGTGGCSGGTFQCVNHPSFCNPGNDPDVPNTCIECVGAVGGGDETCNGQDDDCDNDIDEELTDPTLGQSCDPGVPICDEGTIICDNGALVCDGFTVPGTEICNGVDDDCNDAIDETNCAETEPADDQCIEGECLFECADTEFPCGAGQFCRTFDDDACENPPCRFCVDNPCTGVTCDPGESCDPLSGDCVDLCADVECLAGEECINGFCLDCFDIPCPDGQFCEAGVGCLDDPCDPNPCDPEAEFCRDGDCVPLTCQPECEAGQFCHDGNCLPDLCEDVTCGPNMVCNPFSGGCVGDLCEGRECLPGQTCNPADGTCIDDPCSTINCPDGTECEVTFDGHGVCNPVVIPPDDDDYVYAGGGGCSTSGGSSSWLLLLGMAALLIRRRRR